MPYYTYRCKNCSHQFEKLQKMTAHALVTCPECKQDTLVRIIHGASMVFKGSGFYLTDYKKSSSSEGSHKTASSSPSPNAPGDSKTEKPAKSDPTGETRKTSTDKKPGGAHKQ